MRVGDQDAVENVGSAGLLVNDLRQARSHHLVPFASYLTFNNTVTFKSGFIETGAIQKLGCDFLFAFHSNYCDILYHLRERLIGRNREIIISHLYLTPPQGVTPSEFREDV